ncbi:MAG: hypothetical protein GIW98_06635 [Candidatus Eremiobacteraeota bacterium]|nr:hypothetical protein [Candidatus Eremiobacteraeota bacterium]
MKTVAQRSDGALRALPAARIIDAVSDAAARWRDADFPPRVRVTAALIARTAYCAPMVEYALDRLFAALERAALRATIVDELGSVEILDGFVPRKGRPDAFARGVGRVCIVASRTTIGVALVPAVYALCAKCDVVVKDREDELVAEFFKTLAQEDGEFLTAATALQWNGAQESAEFLRDTEVLVVFGKDQTLRSLREWLAPHARFIGYGSRASAGYVSRESLAGQTEVADLARRASRDVILYESEGCLSLHVMFVESGGALSPHEFSASFARAMEQATLDFPRGPRNDAAAARFDAYRQLSSFRSALGNGSTFSDNRASFCVVFDPPSEQPPPFLPRTIGIHPVQTPQDALRYLRRHAILLEGFALSAHRKDTIDLAIDAGAVRLTSFGRLQCPPRSGGHGGRPRIAEFVRLIDKEL